MVEDDGGGNWCVGGGGEEEEEEERKRDGLRMWEEKDMWNLIFALTCLTELQNCHPHGLVYKSGTKKRVSMYLFPNYNNN